MAHREIAKQILMEVEIAFELHEGEQDEGYYWGRYVAYKHALELLGYEVVEATGMRRFALKEVAR